MGAPALNITGGNCTDLLIGRIGARNESNASALVVRMEAGSVSVKCTVDLVAEIPGILPNTHEVVQIVAHVRVTDLSLSVSLALDHDNRQPPLPVLVGLSTNNAAGCSIEPGLASLQFSASNWFVEKTLNTIAQLVVVPQANACGPKLCAAIDKYLRVSASAVLNKIVRKLILLDMLAPAPPKPVPAIPALPGGTVVWEETMAVSVFLPMLADKLHWDDPVALNAKVQSMLQALPKTLPEQRQWTVALSPAMRFAFRVDGDVSLDFNVTGLGVAARNTTMGAVVALRELAAAFRGVVRLEALPSGLPASAYECAAQAGVNVTDVRGLVELQLGASRAKLDALAFDQLLTMPGFSSMLVGHPDPDPVSGGNFGLELLGASLNATPGLGIQLAKRVIRPSLLEGRRLWEHERGEAAAASAAQPLEGMLANAVDGLFWSTLQVYGGTLRALLNGALGKVPQLVNPLLAGFIERGAPVPPSTLDAGVFHAYAPLAPWMPLLLAVAGLTTYAVGKAKSAKDTAPAPEPPIPRSPSSPGPLVWPPRRALIFSGPTSVITGIAVTLLLLANVFLFVWANTGVGTSLYLFLTKDGRTTVSPAMHWTLLSTFQQMVNSKVYVLGGAVVFASGIWPYLKLFVLLACLLTTPRYLNLRTREAFLVIVDAIGKVSLLDSFFMFMYQAILALDWSNDSGTRKFALVIMPEAGFIVFFGATILGLVLGHIVLAFHRLSLNQDRAGARRTGPQWSPVAVPGRQGGELFSLHGRAPRWLRLAVPAMLAVSLALLPPALFVPAMHTELGGGIAAIYGLLDRSGRMDLTIWQVLTSPFYLNGSGTFATLGWRLALASLAVLFGAVLPALYWVGLLALWITPLRRRGRLLGLAGMQCLRAWATLDICALTMLMGGSQVPQFFRSMPKDPSQAFASICTAVYSTFDMNCFDITVGFRSGLVCGLLHGLLQLIASCLIGVQADMHLSTPHASAPKDEELDTPLGLGA